MITKEPCKHCDNVISKHSALSLGYKVLSFLNDFMGGFNLDVQKKKSKLKIFVYRNFLIQEIMGAECIGCRPCRNGFNKK